MPRLHHVGLLLLLCSFSNLVYGVPTITKYDKVVFLSEGVTANTVLSRIGCSDPDGDATRLSIKKVDPDRPCGSCFQIFDCPSGTDECLQYRTGIDTLDYQSAQAYLITIECDDNRDTPATEVIEVTIRPNSPPEFTDGLYVIRDKTSINRPVGKTFYQTAATDPDNDEIKFSLEVIPSTSQPFYGIDPDSGEIKSILDTRTDCRRDSVFFHIYASDGFHRVGPQVVAQPFSWPNVAPTAVNLDRTVYVPEDTPVGDTIYTITQFDNFIGKNLVVYTAIPDKAAVAEQFTMDGKAPYEIKVAKALNYEDEALREVELTIQFTDTYCESEEYTLKIEVTDVNEEPTLTPERSTVEVCEGKSEFDPGYLMEDEDEEDEHVWQLHRDSRNVYGFLGINTKTGYLSTVVDVDVDETSTGLENPSKYVVQVMDKGKLTATATVWVTFLDCNDNPPVWNGPKFGMAVSECETPGVEFARITGSDDDSDRENNNKIFYEGTGGAVSILRNGNFILNNPLAAGNVITFNVYVRDQGQTPGPLRSVNPSVISVRFTECPTPPPTVPTTTPAAVVTTPQPKTTPAPSTTTEASSGGSGGDDDLVAIIAGTLVGVIGLGAIGLLACCYFTGGLARCCGGSSDAVTNYNDYDDRRYDTPRERERRHDRGYDRGYERDFFSR